MANVTVETIIAFSKAVMTQYYQKCRTSIMALPPEQKVFTPVAKKTRIRQVVSGGAGDYTGQYENVGESSKIEYKEYEAICDRYKQLIVDYLDEMASKPEGAKESILALAEDFINRCMASEIDAYSIASWVKAMNTENVFTNVQMKTDKDNIWNTLLTLQGKVFDEGVDADEELVTFVSNEIYQNMQKYILENNGLANGALLRNRDAVYDFGVEELGDPIEVTTKIIQFNNMTIIPMQSNRMNTEIILYDGKSDGQTLGGWAPSPESKKVDIIVMPKSSGFIDVRYEVLNYLIPALAAEGSNISGGFDSAINKVLGDVVIQNIGVNQKANAYEVDFRTVYQADLFDIKSNACFAVTA